MNAITISGFPFREPKQNAARNCYQVDVLPHVELPYRLRKLRNGCSQSEKAKKLGVSYQVYQRLETPGKCNPAVKTIEKLSKVFGKKLELVFFVRAIAIKANRTQSTIVRIEVGTSVPGRFIRP